MFPRLSQAIIKDRLAKAATSDTALFIGTTLGGGAWIVKKAKSMPAERAEKIMFANPKSASSMAMFHYHRDKWQEQKEKEVMQVHKDVIRDHSDDLKPNLTSNPFGN